MVKKTECYYLNVKSGWAVVVSKSRSLVTGSFYFKKLSAIKRMINIIPNSEKTKR